MNTFALPRTAAVSLPRPAPAVIPRTNKRAARAGLLKGWLASRWSYVTSPLLVLAAWVIVTALELAPEQILVSPLQVLRAGAELLASGELQEHLQVSLFRLVTGVALGSLGGIALGIVLGLFKGVRPFVAPTFHVLRQIPSVALIPLFILLFGIGETFKVVIVIKASFFIVALGVYDAITNLPSGHADVASVLKFTRWQTIRMVILPSIVPPTLTVVRLALGRCWMVLVGAELLAAESGLGQMMEMARQMFRMDVVMVGVVLAGVIGVVLDRGIRKLESYLMRWQS